MNPKYIPGPLIIYMLILSSVLSTTYVAAQQLGIDTSRSQIVWDDYDLTGAQSKLTPRAWFKWWYIPTVTVPPGVYLLISQEEEPPPVLPPIINCLPDQTLSWAQELPPPDPEGIVVTNNCPEDGLTIEHSGDNSNGGNGCVGDPLIIQRTYTVTDACGNTVSCTQDYIFLIDNEAPNLNYPPDIILECTEDISPSNIGNAVATDNCTPQQDIVIDFTDDISSLTGCSATGTIIRTWSATDNCGNRATCTQTITVEDTTAPVFTDVPADLTVDCANIPSPYEVIATDNCTPGAELSFTFEEIISGGCPYTLTRTWTVTDECGNASTHTQTITVEDNTAPVFTDVPVDITVDCANIPPPYEVVATDDCTPNLTLIFDEMIDGGCPYTITRTWTVIDECGNASTYTQTITVEDNTAPVISCPIDVFVICGQSTDPVVTGMPLPTDDCSAVSVEYTDDLSNQSGCSGFIIRTFTVIDECGNSVSCEQIITIVDIPEISNRGLTGQWMIGLNPNRFLLNEWDDLHDQSIEDLASLIEHPPVESFVDFRYIPDQYGGVSAGWLQRPNVLLRFGIGQLSGKAFADLEEGISTPIHLKSHFYAWQAFGGVRHYFGTGSYRLFTGADVYWRELSIVNRRLILNDQHFGLLGTLSSNYLDVSLKAGLLFPIGKHWAVEMEMSPAGRVGRDFAKKYDFLIDLKYRFW